MKVRVRAKVASYTDGRERFARRQGEVRRPPAGRSLLDADNPWLPGEVREQAYTVHFEDGDDAVFLSHELDSDQLDLPRFQEIEGVPFGGIEGVTAGDEAQVTEVRE